MRRLMVFILMLCAPMARATADWPTVRGDVARTGRAAGLLDSRSTLAWRTALTDSPVAACVEPIVAGGRVHVGAMNGRVFTLDADDGHVIWSVDIGGPILHSPAWGAGPGKAKEGGRLYVGSIDGGLTCLDAATGKQLWRYDVGQGGFAASPAVLGDRIYIGARNGTFYALRDRGASPSLLWARDLGAPVWQTAAVLDPQQYPERNGVFVMAEDMVARCLDAGDGTVLWQSRQVGGSTARDTYPVVAGEWVIFVTAPAVGADDAMMNANRVLLKASKLETINDAHAVRTLRHRADESMIKWRRREAYAVGVHLERHPGEQTVWAFRAADGTPGRSPILWGAGSGGAMSPPAVSPDGRAIVLWRSWYNGWIHGERFAYASLSPIRGIGFLDPATGTLKPLLPSNVASPPFGANFRLADESAALQVAGGRLLAVHQGGICSMNLSGGPIRSILSERGTWMGAANAPWQGGEWRGPVRSGMAIVNGRGYAVCGGYVTCFAMDGAGIENDMPHPPAERVDHDIQTEPLEDAQLDAVLAPPPGAVELTAVNRPLADALAKHIEAYLNHGPYAPRRVLLGRSGVYIDFAQSAPEVTALARAYPYLPEELQTRLRKHLLKLLAEYPPWQDEPTGSAQGGPTCQLPISDGPPRERWRRDRHMDGTVEPAIGIGSLYGVWLLAERADGWDAVAKAWPSIKLTLEAAFMRHFYIGLDVPQNPRRHRRGHWAMNRVTAGLIAYIRMAEKLGDTIAARKGRQRLAEVLGEMQAFWSELKYFPDAAYFGESTRARGDVLLLLSNAVPRPRTPDCWSLSQLSHLQPEVLRFLTTDATMQANLTRLLQAVETVGPAWYVTEADSFIHFGDNRMLVPGSTPGIMLAMATLQPQQHTAERLMEYVDLPACPGDWNYVERLVTAIEAIGGQGR